MVMVSAGSDFKIRRISLCATVLEGAKKDEKAGDPAGSVGPTAPSAKSERQVSAGDRSGCCDVSHIVPCLLEGATYGLVYPMETVGAISRLTVSYHGNTAGV